MKTLSIGTDFQKRQEAREKLGRLLAAALREGRRAVQAADDAARAPYRPSDPALLRELKRCLLAAKQQRDDSQSLPCIDCGRAAMKDSRFCQHCFVVVKL